MVVFYFLIGLFATTLGAIAGLGGGVIIKPFLDLLGHYDVATIGILSAATVLSMATVSMFKAKKIKIKMDKRISLIIAMGSIMGGILGKGLFNYLINSIQIEKGIAVFQSSLLAILMLIILVLTQRSDKIPKLFLKNKVIIFVVGLTLGLISAFLGIGGGPLNVAVLGLLFSMKPKEAAFNSIFIIFFSQISALILTGVDTGFGIYDLSMLIYMIIGGIIGGWIGSSLISFISDKQVKTIFTVAVFFILMINLYNVISII